MAREPAIKELTNTRLANNYGGWIYCEGCNRTIGYLCYVTYDDFQLGYRCTCGNTGSIHIAFAGEPEAENEGGKLMTVKNRLCCPGDQSPLFTILEKNLDTYRYKVTCKACGKRRRGGKEGQVDDSSR